MDGLPLRGPAHTRNGAKNAHSSSDIRLRDTTALPPRAALNKASLDLGIHSVNADYRTRLILREVVVASPWGEPSDVLRRGPA